MKSALVLLFAVVAPAFAFVYQPSRAAFKTTSLNGGPFDKFTNRQEYDKTVEGLMLTKGKRNKLIDLGYGSEVS